MLISGAGLVGVGYSLATRPTPAPAPVVFVPEQVEARAGTPPRPPASVQEAIDQTRPQTQQQTQPHTQPQTAPAYEPAPTPERGLSIDVNTATAAQLELLPGIGPSRAAAIIESRNTMGPFRTVEDLARVHGIGPTTVEGVRPYVRVEPGGGGG
jgi:competence protein ComEA